jgi:hypothetical protein
MKAAEEVGLVDAFKLSSNMSTGNGPVRLPHG